MAHFRESLASHLEKLGVPRLRYETVRERAEFSLKIGDLSVKQTKFHERHLELDFSIEEHEDIGRLKQMRVTYLLLPIVVSNILGILDDDKNGIFENSEKFRLICEVLGAWLLISK